MPSKKCQKYMKQYEDSNYAPKIRKIEKSDLIQHSNRGPFRKTPETSCSHSHEPRREGKEKINLVFSSNPGAICKEVTQTEFVFDPIKKEKPPKGQFKAVHKEKSPVKNKNLST